MVNVADGAGEDANVCFRTELGRVNGLPFNMSHFPEFKRSQFEQVFSLNTDCFLNTNEIEIFGKSHTKIAGPVEIP